VTTGDRPRQRGLRQHRARFGRVLGVLLATALLATALLVAGCAGEHPPHELVVGAGTDQESTVLAELYAAALRYYGSAARVEHMADPVAKLDTGQADVVPGFTGRVLERFAPGTAAIQDKNVYRAMVAALPEGVAAGDYTTAAQDKPQIAVTEQTAAAWGGRELTTLVQHCAKVTTGSVAGARYPTVIGGCKPPAHDEFATEAALFAALRAGQVNAAWTTTADPDIPGDVVVLADRRPPIVQAENVVALYRRNDLSDQQVLAINEIAGEFDTAALADMRRQAAHGADPRQAADAWLAAHPLGR
jgi:glycine betaine/choline ABC-type transport system substrate-binding protein